MKHKALASLCQFSCQLMKNQLEQRKKLEMFCETMLASKTGDFGVTTMTRDAKAKVINERWGELKKRLDVYPVKVRRFPSPWCFFEFLFGTAM
ncbi:uncharacterized protein B0T23DRAFT_317144 [Neurospora hispaniola]|uniref:Uncharacterized protein n=1 Tax=Neurospora hispaniola TaxID=588809 RepID=A0AAJ0I8N9_9PEZI|nr:hypothetical protein B0T23DRAFT_317144 [Neurospora hispaniola]